MRCWLILSYELCKVIESDESSYGGGGDTGSAALSHEIRGGRVSVTQLTGEEHARLRPLYLKVLSPSAMTQYRTEHVLPIVNDAIDQIQARGSAELVSEFAFVVPSRVMASLFGLPWRDDELISTIAKCHRNVVAWAYDQRSEDKIGQGKMASVELSNIFRPLIVKRRETSGDDLISQLWTLVPQYWANVEVGDVLSIVRDIAIASGETTTNAIANAIYLYLTNASAREAVKGQEGALNALVEESLRLLGSIQFRFRTANIDVSLAGVKIKRGDNICMVHAAANRDRSRYLHPHMVDLARKRPTDHLAFSVGPRMCPGLHLARLMIRECLKSLIARLPEVRLDDKRGPPRFRGFSHRSFGPLHVVC
ncbi:hypothetical protein XH80_09540 [Bradyrhizobium sp. CCBAU 45384]|nr:hypothetical protein [Bradyrhizobium sp. CCBAU 45384]